MPSAAALAIAALLAVLPGGARADDSCCADLEGRVAALESIAAMQEDKTVALAISGAVNRNMLSWEPAAPAGRQAASAAPAGLETAVADQAADAAALAPRSRTAGFVIELGFTDASSLFAGPADEIDPADAAFHTALANWYVEADGVARAPRQGLSRAVARIDLARPVTYPVHWQNVVIEADSGAGDYAGLSWGQTGSARGGL
jgi:hypothetical protein